MTKDNDMSEDIKNKEPKIDEKFSEIEEIIKKMEDKSLSLEDSFELYKSGLKTLKECNDIVDRVEKQLIILKEEDIDV